MKSASTDRRTYLIRNQLKSSQGHSYTKATYIDDDGLEQVFTDLKYPVHISKQGKPPEYANTNYKPAAAQTNFSVINRAGIYSNKNTASDYNGIFVKNRLFKFYDGKRLNELSDTADNIDFDMINAFHFFTKASGNSIVLDVENTDGETDNYFQDLFDLYYSGGLYSGGTYTPAGYFVATLNRQFKNIEKWNSFTVTCPSTGHSVYYRMGVDKDEIEFANTTSDDWTFAGYTTGGTDVFNLDVEKYSVIQVAVIYDGVTWSDTVTTTITLDIQSYVEWVLLGSFYLDDPKFTDKPAGEISIINITGRNSWKKALEVEINLPDVSSMYLDDLIEEVADQTGLSYTASSIADLSGYGLRVLTGGYGDSVKVDEIFNDIMDIIGKDYRMWIDDDNVLWVTARSTAYLVDTVFNYKNYIKADESNQSDKQLQRVTVFNKKNVLNATITLGSDTFVASGAQEISWANNAIAKYWEKTINSGTLDISDVEFDDTNKKAIFTLTGAGSITITVKGNEFSSTEPDYFGEAANITNLEANNGQRIQIENLLVKSMTEAKQMAENKIDDFGTPEFNVKVLTSYLHSLEDINDLALWVSEDLFDSSIFEIIGIEHIISSEVSKKTELELLDTGRKFTDEGNIVWDRDLYGDTSAWQFDIGIFYDSSYRIGVTRNEILAQKTYIRDVDF